MHRLKIGLLLLGICRLPAWQQPSPAEAPPIQTADEALERLPPIGREGTFDKQRMAWNFDPAVSWLKDHLARGGTLSDEQWRRALLRSGSFRVRERWPIDRPFAVSVEIPAWLPLSEIRLSTGDSGDFEGRAGSTSPLMCGNCAASARMRWRYQELQVLPLGSQTVSFQVVVERGSDTGPSRLRRDTPPPEGPPAGVLWKGTLDFQIQGVATFEEALPAAHDEVLNATVRRAIGVAIVNDRRLWVDGDVDRVPELATTGLSLEIELREGTTVRETESLVVIDRPGAFSQSVGWDLPADLTDPSNWSVHVRGRAAEALHAWNAQRYWDGELVIPLADVPRH
ncbi:MAG: hypothetical protein HOP15_18195 [Planctomycetes bacterium]|nr:hypothetical protein [Planctomycetota bacterium]